MNVPDVKRQFGSSTRKPFTTYLVFSIAFHAIFIAGLVGSAQWLNKPTYFKPVSHTVSLVDAPATLHEAPQVGQHKSTNKKTAPKDKQQPKHTRSDPQKKTPTHPQTPSQQQVKPPLVSRQPNVETPTKVATSRPAQTTKSEEQNKGKPKTAASKPQKTSKPSSPTSETKRQKAAKPLSPSPPPTATTKTDQVQQQAAEQRLSALRSRYGKYGQNTSDATSNESLQHVRLRAYQELVREQIVDAWVLPLLQNTARNLQATALLTVDREGHITQLEILKTSNNPLFDASLIRAIRQAAPLPALPEDYRGSFLELELHFNPGET